MASWPNPSRRTILGAGLAALARGAAQAAELDTFIEEARRKAPIPGLAAAASRGARILYAAGHGLADIAEQRPADSHTAFHITSITKTVTATAVMQLVERGRMALDADVSTYLRAPLRHPAHPRTPITVRQLLTHTSGISDRRYYEVDFRTRGRDAELPLETFVDDYLRPGGRHFSTEECFAAAPGAAWDYSNVGYAVLGLAAGKAGGGGLRRITERRIFSPVKMAQARWSLAAPRGGACATPYDLVEGRPTPVEPVGLPDWPAGAIRASAADLIRFVAAGAAGGPPILSRRSQAEMLRMTTPPGLPAWLTGQGLGWQESDLAGRRVANHWGGDRGVFTAAYLDAERHVAAVVLTNTSVTDAARAAVKAIAARLLDHAAGA